jgi:GH15 family glucan-1,4-alpha-glucosidase
MPAFDEGSVFGRLLDADAGGYCSIGGGGDVRRVGYLEGTLVLETRVHLKDAEARVIDCFLIDEDAERHARKLARVVDGVRGVTPVTLWVAPRFDYAASRPWLRPEGASTFSAIAGNDALVVRSDRRLERVPHDAVQLDATVEAGERVRLLMTWALPEELDDGPPGPLDPKQLDAALDVTVEWWRRWADGLRIRDLHASELLRSAITLKALTYRPTGAIAAAVTTSLPETPGGDRTWDYRYSWIRDSAWAARSLVDLGAEAEAGAFRRFVERSAAGTADQLQILFGVDGRRRVDEATLDHLAGYRGSGPVRVGNRAARQLQLDAYGHLVYLSWQWHLRGHEPSDEDWRFLVQLVETAGRRWSEPDCGIWEWRGPPKHFVLSKAMCWLALDRGIALAEDCLRRAPLARWRRTRDAIRRAVERRGVDRRRGVFVQAFDANDMDAALLRLPALDFVAYDDPRMVATVDAICEDLAEGPLLRRYRVRDGLRGREGAFLPCSFWLVECLARQGRVDEARRVFADAARTANDVGLFAEEYDVRAGELLGNYPQALTHLSHIEAILALEEAGQRSRLAETSLRRRSGMTNQTVP